MNRLVRFLGKALGVLVVLATGTGGCEEQPDFWKLGYDAQEKRSRAAALANPSLVKQLNTAAADCVGKIQSDMEKVADSNPFLRGIGKHQPKVGYTKYPEVVLCRFTYHKNEIVFQVPMGNASRPGKDGIILEMSLQDMVFPPYVSDVTASYRMLSGGIFVKATYRLELGENHKNLLRPMRNIVEKRLMEFCNAHADKEIIYYDSDTSRDTTLKKGDAAPQH